MVAWSAAGGGDGATNGATNGGAELVSAASFSAPVQNAHADAYAEPGANLYPRGTHAVANGASDST